MAREISRIEPMLDEIMGKISGFKIGRRIEGESYDLHNRRYSW